MVFDQSHIRNVLEMFYSVCSARFSFPERILLILLARRSDYMSVPAVTPIVASSSTVPPSVSLCLALAASTRLRL